MYGGRISGSSPSSRCGAAVCTDTSRTETRPTRSQIVATMSVPIYLSLYILNKMMWVCARASTDWSSPNSHSLPHVALPARVWDESVAAQPRCRSAHRTHAHARNAPRDDSDVATKRRRKGKEGAEQGRGTKVDEVDGTLGVEVGDVTAHGHVAPVEQLLLRAVVDRRSPHRPPQRRRGHSFSSAALQTPQAAQQNK